MQELLPIVADELSAFLKAKDKREFLITRCEHYYDELVEPVDLPGPDRVVDPLLRSAIRPLVGRLYDAAVEKLEANTNAA